MESIEHKLDLLGEDRETFRQELALCNFWLEDDQIFPSARLFPLFSLGALGTLTADGKFDPGPFCKGEHGGDLVTHMNRILDYVIGNVAVIKNGGRGKYEMATDPELLDFLKTKGYRVTEMNFGTFLKSPNCERVDFTALIKGDLCESTGSTLAWSDYPKLVSIIEEFRRARQESAAETGLQGDMPSVMELMEPKETSKTQRTLGARIRNLLGLGKR